MVVTADSPRRLTARSYFHLNLKKLDVIPEPNRKVILRRMTGDQVAAVLLACPHFPMDWERRTTVKMKARMRRINAIAMK